MKGHMESESPEIPHLTLAAAQILGYDPQALWALYDNDFFQEIEDNQILGAQMDEIYKVLGTIFDTENEETKEKFLRAMEIDPLFKKFVFDFLIDNCAEQVVSCSSLLSKETFKEVLTLIDKDESLKEKLDDAIDGAETMRASQLLAINMNIRYIKMSLDNILYNHLDEDLFLPDSDSRKIHELAFKAAKSFGTDLNEQEERDYEKHANEGPCSICYILERNREFKTFQDFLDFIKDAREFVEIMIKSRDPKPESN